MPVLRLAADENVNNAIVRGLVRRKPDVDVVGVEDLGLSSAEQARPRFRCQRGSALEARDGERAVSAVEARDTKSAPPKGRIAQATFSCTRHSPGSDLCRQRHIQDIAS